MIHPSADVSPDARIGPGTNVWHQAQVREDAVVGKDCVLGKGAYVDRGVVVGDRVKVQNYASLYHGVAIEDDVYVGPQAVLANDRYPRATNVDGTPKADGDWQIGPVLVRQGASIGAGAVVLPGVTIGRWAMIGAGAVVTHDVPDHTLVVGNPAHVAGRVCACGRPLTEERGAWRCLDCDRTYDLLPAGARSQ